MQSFPPPTYQDLEVKHEIEETPESHLLHVQIPDGFAREQISAKVEYDFGRVRIYGERSLGNNKRGRFNVVSEVPEYCDINRIRGKFDGTTVTVTMPKIPEKVFKQESQPTKQEVPKSPIQETQSKPEDDKKDISSHSATTNDDQENTTMQDQVPKSTIQSKEKVGHEISTQPTATEESMPQKGQEAIPQETITEVESKKHIGQETSAQSKAIEESKSQKSEEGIPPKATITEVESKQQADHEASNLPKDTKEYVPQKGQEEISQKATITTDAKLETKEKFVGETNENEEKQKEIRKEENKDHLEKIVESRNPPKKAMVVDDFPTNEKESKEERKRSPISETFSKKDIQKEKGMEVNGKNGSDDANKQQDKKAMSESTTRTRIKKVADSTSQVVTNIAKRFNEEDKQRLIYMGAAAIVVALGVYATYKFRASRRP